MTKKMKPLVITLLRLTVISILVTGVLGVHVTRVSSQAATSLIISPASSTLDTCEELEIAVLVENVTNLTAYHLEISYEPGLVEIVEVRNGGFLYEGLYEPSNQVDPSAGLILFGMAQQNSVEHPLDPKTGSGNLVFIRMRALQAGVTVHFTIGASSVLVNWPEVTAIPYDAYGGEVTTQAYTNVVQNWYLAEGYTGEYTDTFILIQNPGISPAQICVSYMLQGGGIKFHQVEVGPQSRDTINTRDAEQVGPGYAFSTNLASSQDIIVERSMYWPIIFNLPDDLQEVLMGGHASTGVTSPSTVWYLAEGFTGAGFQTFILIQNPNDQAAEIQVTYMPDAGDNIVKNFTVAAQSRFTIEAHDTNPDGLGIGLDKAFATRVVSTNGEPIVVERAMYFANEGHEAMGITATSNTWYLAEGFTDMGFSTFILIQNPNPDPADVTVTYMLTDATTVQKQVTVGANSRFTIVASEDTTFGVGAGKTFSTKLVSTQPIIVERAMYWPNGTMYWPDETVTVTQAGHDSPGVTTAARTWNLAEGWTGVGFETYILVQNPNAVWADITIQYMVQGGGVVTKMVSIQPNSRFTIIGSEGQADKFGVGTGLAFATQISSNQPIIVERAMYFTGGGHGTTGVASNE